MSKVLFEESGDSDSEIELSTNKDYAKTYNTLRKKELLQKYKDRGLDVSESDSSSSESESSEEEVVDPKFDEEFFKTLASLKSKSPAIYDKNTKFFDEDEDVDNEDSNDKKLKKEKHKPVTIKDYERKIILENDGKFEEDSDEEDVEDQRPVSPTIVEEERRLKAEFKKVLQDDDSADEEFGGIFKKRQKTKEEQDKEDEDYVKWLAGKKEHIKPDVKEKLEPLKNYWSNDKLPQSEKFLRDYILNKGYANAKSSEIPTYDEIIGDNAPLSEDEQELEKQAEFEQKFNFRFEEPDQEFIKRFPRTIENSLRLKDDKRKQKREETKQRKQKEKEQKLRELEMVKEMKRKEIEEKIRKLKLVTGNEELGFKDEELEDDFDPEAHDRRMKEIFNDDYYGEEDGEEKPECPSDIEELKYEDWDNYDPHEDNENYDNAEAHCEDEDFNMDCDYDPAAAKEQLQKELIENTKGRRRRKGKRNRFAEILKQDKPVFDPELEQSFPEYFDEYYKIDCEDFVGDLPCRFKYVETTPNDFGLTIEEIILAKNKELNQWASLKKAVQIRPEHIEKKEQRIYKMKAKNEDLKRKIFKSLYGEDGSDEEEENLDENIKNVKEELRTEEEKDESKTQESNDPSSQENQTKKSKKKRKRKAQATNSAETADSSESATEAKKMKTEESQKELNESIPTISGVVATTVQNKKKKNKNKAKANPDLSSSNNSQKSTNPQNNPFKESKNNSPTNKKDFSSVSKKPLAVSAAKKQNPKVNGKNLKKPFKESSQKSENSSSNPFKNGSSPANGKGDSLPPISKKSNKFAKNLKNKSKNFKNVKRNAHGQDSKISDDRLKAYGINPRKFHKKQKYGNKPAS